MARRQQASPTDHTILVVDEQEETRRSTQRLLEREGHRVLTAESGEHALALFREHDVHLLLVDYMMPRMNGEELVRQIRAIDPFVQIILQTGFSGGRPPRVALGDLDVQGYHDKAEGPEKLLLWVDAGLKVHRLISSLRQRHVNRAALTATATVLLAGDSRPALESRTATLEGEGHRVLAASSAAAALQLFVRERPDLLVVDQTLLEANDKELLRRVRAVDAGVPIIMQCGALDPAQQQRAIRDLELHGLCERDEQPAHVLQLVESGLASMRRVENVRACEELRGLILAKLCHDLRSSLHVIRGYTDMLQGDPAAEPCKEIVARLGLASETAIGLTQDYLDLARLESPGVMVRCEPVDVDALLEDLRALGGREIGTRPLRLNTCVPFSGAVIDTDGEKLRAILAQLLANAIKFSLSGEIRLAVRSGPGHTDFVLSDAGPGIKEDDLPILFSPFRQLRDQTLASTPGQGVGLAIALRLSALIGATLTAKRSTDAGTMFTLSVPGKLGRGAGAPQPTLH